MPRCNLLTTVLLLAAVMGRASAQTPTAEQILDQVGITPSLGQRMPLDVPLQDHRGQPTTLDDVLSDQPAVVCFVYFQCPMLCKLAADGLVRSLNDLNLKVGDDFQAVIISFDPRDTPKQAGESRRHLLRRYKDGDSDRGWHFLTGQADGLQDLTAAFGYRHVWDQATQQYAHPAGLFFLAPDGTLTECLGGLEFSPDQLRTAFHNAGQNIVSQPAEDTDAASNFLRCYVYDPTTGRFGALVQWTVRALGVATVIGMAIGIRSLNRSRRQLEQ